MPQVGLIAPEAQRTPLSIGGSRRTPRDIPDDLLKEASQRLAVMSLMAAVLWVVASVLWHLQLGSGGSNGLQLSPFESSDVIAIVATIASLALFFYARRTKREPQFILNLGIAYMILTAVAL